jgi:hypothetical protein
MGAKQMLVSTEEYFNGVAKTYKFENGYGASVVCHDGSYGGPYNKNQRNRWEIAVLDLEGQLCYHTPITQDVIGHQTEEQVLSVLKEISELKEDLYKQEQLELEFAQMQSSEVHND